MVAKVLSLKYPYFQINCKSEKEKDLHFRAPVLCLGIFFNRIFLVWETNNRSKINDTNTLTDVNWGRHKENLVMQEQTKPKTFQPPLTTALFPVEIFRLDTESLLSLRLIWIFILPFCNWIMFSSRRPFCSNLNITFSMNKYLFFAYGLFVTCRLFSFQTEKGHFIKEYRYHNETKATICIIVMATNSPG